MEYIVEVRNIFEAEDHEDAVRQMAAWLDDHAYSAGYRAYGPNDQHNQGVFIDAEDIEWGDV